MAKAALDSKTCLTRELDKNKSLYSSFIVQLGLDRILPVNIHDQSSNMLQPIRISLVFLFP